MCGGLEVGEGGERWEVGERGELVKLAVVARTRRGLVRLGRGEYLGVHAGCACRAATSAG